MRRRAFITLLGSTAAAWSFGAVAQQTQKLPRIGYLSPGAPTLSANDRAFLLGLRELGYVEGRNILIEYRFADGKFDRLADFAVELVRLEVDVIVAAVTQASLAAKAATRTIPIVILATSDPIGSGLVASLARPGDNVTGTSAMNAEVVGKSLELLKEVVPKLSRVAVLWNPSNAIFQAQMLQGAERAAGVLELQLRKFGASSADELDPAFAAIIRENADALLVMADPILIVHRARIIDFAARNRLPAVYGAKVNVESGGLMGYGPDMSSQFFRGAAYVDKILKGAKPADLPVQQPTKFELVINMKTAKSLGLTIPLPLLGRAEEVIE